MTMPHLMNCAHLDDGWCLDCVVTLNARAEAAEDRAEAAEQKLREIAQFTLKTNTRAEAAEAEVGRLQAALDQWKQCGDAIMLCATGRAAPLSDSEVCGEIVRLRERNKELEMWFSVALDLLSDFLETLN